LRLYYLTTAETALKYILPERRLKLSRFNELNDPFELLAYSIGEKDMRRAVKAMQAHFENKWGLICFSDNWQSPVMWAHYAQKHHGLCLGFDVPDERKIYRKVDYNPKRLQFVLDHTKRLSGFDEEFIEAMCYTKAAEWSYEHEYRTMAKLEEQDPKTGLFYVDFGPDLQLREVILGHRNTTPVGQIAKTVGRYSHAVTVSKARAAFNEFAIVRNQAVKAVSTKPIRPAPNAPRIAA
jgi:hypothetical protein